MVVGEDCRVNSSFVDFRFPRNLRLAEIAGQGGLPPSCPTGFRETGKMVSPNRSRATSDSWVVAVILENVGASAKKDLQIAAGGCREQ